MIFTIKDFDLTFEAKGLRPLFQGISLDTYMPPESVLLVKENIGSSYISKKTLFWMKGKGIELFSQKDLSLLNDIKAIIKKAYEKSDVIKDVSDISLEDVKACFHILRDLSVVYGYFDNGYLDGAYEAAKTSTQAAANVKEIEVYKNVSREDINRMRQEDCGTTCLTRSLFDLE